MNNLALLVACASALLWCVRTSAEDRIVIGRVENVLMQDVGMSLKARIDSGAGVSSIHASVVRIEKAEDGRGERVVFKLTDDRGATKTVRRAIVEWAQIKGKGTDSYSRRPVVILDICLGGKKLEGRFNLANRGSFLYPVLVGRNILNTGDFLIDPKRKFMEHPGCEP
jgi:hypothetical protein